MPHSLHANFPFFIAHNAMRNRNLCSMLLLYVLLFYASALCFCSKLLHYASALSHCYAMSLCTWRWDNTVTPYHNLIILVWLCFYTALYGIVLHRAVPYGSILYYTVLFCTVLYCTVLCCSVLYCTVLYCIIGGASADSLPTLREPSLRRAGASAPPGKDGAANAGGRAYGKKL